MPRSATIDRQTSETQIKLSLKLDGKGIGQIATPVPFIDHMLTLLARHGFFDLSVEANEISARLEAKAHQGPATTEWVKADWRERMEDAVRALVNSPEMAFVP